MTSREISIPTSFLHFRSNFDESQFWPCCMKLYTLLYFFDASTQFLGVSSIFFCIGADELLASFLGEDKETCSFSWNATTVLLFFFVWIHANAAANITATSSWVRSFVTVNAVAAALTSPAWVKSRAGLLISTRFAARSKETLMRERKGRCRVLL